MITKIAVETLKNLIKFTEVFNMFNPDAPENMRYSGYLSSTPVVQVPTYTVGYTPNPFITGNVISSPATPQSVIPMNQIQQQTAAVPQVPAFNQMAPTSAASSVVTNPWANNNNNNATISPVAGCVATSNPSFGISPTLPPSIDLSIDKKWNQAEPVPLAPDINWNNNPNVYLSNTNAVIPQYPANYSSVTVTDWNTICETNFKKEF